MKQLYKVMWGDGKHSITNALTYIQKGIEAYKTLETPCLVISKDGEHYEIGSRIPYNEDNGVRTFVDFMLIYLDEAIKSLEKDKSE